MKLPSKLNLAVIALLITVSISALGLFTFNEYFNADSRASDSRKTNSPKEYATNFNSKVNTNTVDKCNCKLHNFTQCSEMAKTICMPNGINTPFYHECYQKIVDSCWTNSS